MSVFTRARFVLSLVVAVSVVLLGSDCEDQRLTNLDNGLDTHNGYETEPYVLPWSVVVDSEVLDPDFGFDRSQITEAVNWWNDNIDRDGTDRTWFTEEPVTGQDGVLHVTVGFTGGTEEEPVGGLLEAAYSEGFILYGTIIVSSDLSYDEDTVLAILKHEMGHAMGLADDPGPPETVDLNSIMGSPLVLDGELTDHDFELLVQ